MTSIDPDQERQNLGELIRFPQPRDNNDQNTTTDGATARTVEPEPADVEPESTEDSGDTGDDADSAPNAEVATDTERAVVRRAGRVPPALAAGGRAAREVAVRAKDRAKPLAKQGGIAGVRHGSYLVGGSRQAARSAWRRLQHSDIDDAIRAAKSSGELSLVVELEQKKRDAANDRWQRVAHQVKLAAQISAGGAIAAGGLSLTVAIAGGLMQLIPGGGDWSSVAGYWAAWGWLFQAIAVLWSMKLYLLAGVFASALVAAWKVGFDSDTTPDWARAPGRRTAEEPAEVTPHAVVLALRELGISKLSKAIKDSQDAGAEFVGSIALAGCGVEVTVTLPRGVDTADILAKRRKLAENLDRHEHELFITVPNQARTVTLWVADPGALDEPIGPSPLETDPEITADYYTGRAPWGQNLRGDQVALTLKQMHLLITGLSNQGKTAALRALVLWLLLDRSVEAHIADLKGIGDWHMFTGIASTLIEGPSDAHVVQATEMLESGVAEMNRRLAEHDRDKYPDGVPRELARKPGSGFHPLVLIVDEAQVAYMCPEVDEEKVPYGGQKATSRFFRAARQIHNQGRAVNVVLWQGTQDPTNENLPKIVREGAHIRASLVVGTESQARMAIGEKAVNSGAEPHKLRQGKDKGTVVATGDGVPTANGENSMTIRTHFIDGDTAQQLADRIRTQRGTHPEATSEHEDRDLLADVAHVLGTDNAARATTVIHRLQDLARGYEPYQALTAKSLADTLDAEHSVPVRNKDGYLTVRTQRVHAALADRDEHTPTDQD